MSRSGSIVAFGEKKEASLIDTYKEISKDMIDHITGPGRHSITDLEDSSKGEEKE